MKLETMDKFHITLLLMALGVTVYIVMSVETRLVYKVLSMAVLMGLVFYGMEFISRVLKRKQVKD